MRIFWRKAFLLRFHQCNKTTGIFGGEPGIAGRG